MKTNTQSTRIIAIGVAVFIIGGALLLLVFHKSGHSPKAAASTAPTTSTTIPGAVTVASQSATPTSFEFQIPKGDNAVAVPMSYFPGLAGYVKAGDSVNAYSVIKTGCSASIPTGVRLLLSNVKVLSVIGSPPAATGQPASFLLALNPEQAAEVIYAESFETLYFTLTTGSDPALPTSGAPVCTNAL